jgi:hypothetical protein
VSEATLNTALQLQQCERLHITLIALQRYGDAVSCSSRPALLSWLLLLLLLFLLFLYRQIGGSSN